MLCALVSDTGAELISVTKNNNEFIWQADPAYWSSHAPILFPVCGRLLSGEYSYKGISYKMDSHGFAKKSDFILLEQSESHIVLSFSSNEETKKVYPFDFNLKASYSIEEEKLIARFEIKNQGNEVMPYMFGWHPGFNLGDKGKIQDHSIYFDGKENVVWHKLQNGCFVNPYEYHYKLKSGKYFLSEEEIYSNDTIIFANAGNKVDLLSSDNSRIISLEYSKNLPYLCIWKAPYSEARYICIEPWSDVPSDGETPENFDTRKMSRLAIGEKIIYKYSVKFN